jgi:glycosyltransferase involved in cell wall biosynthesis
MKKVVVGHPTGNSNVCQTLQALVELKLLRSYVTGFDFNSLHRIVPINAFDRRLLLAEIQPFVNGRSMRELLRLVCSRSRYLRHLTFSERILSVDRVGFDVDRIVANALQESDVLIGYEDNCLSAFRRAKKMAIPRIYDLAHPYFAGIRHIIYEERELHPAWAVTAAETQDNPNKYLRKSEEIALASEILVASDFTRRSLPPSATGKTVTKIPYGCDRPCPRELLENELFKKRRIQVVFVGALSLRKGLPYLKQIVDEASSFADFTVIGDLPPVVPKPLEEMLAKVEYHPSRFSKEDLRSQMRRHDVLLLPSIAEGFGLVLCEALSQGVIPITTENTGGPEILTHGTDGFVFPIRQADPVIQTLWRLSSDSEIIREMRLAAWLSATRHSWVQYRHRLGAYYKKHCLVRDFIHQ